MRFCAHDWSRTSTSVRTLPPQGSVSTNSTTWALNWSEVKQKKLSKSLTFCDLTGARTQDPLLKREMLYQLSYQV